MPLFFRPKAKIHDKATVSKPQNWKPTGTYKTHQGDARVWAQHVELSADKMQLTVTLNPAGYGRLLQSCQWHLEDGDDEASAPPDSLRVEGTGTAARQQPQLTFSGDLPHWVAWLRGMVLDERTADAVLDALPVRSDLQIIGETIKRISPT